MNYMPIKQTALEEMDKFLVMCDLLPKSEQGRTRIQTDKLPVIKLNQ